MLTESFYLYNQLGSLVQQTTLTLGINDIETGELAPGMYFWELRAATVATCRNGIVF